MVSRSLLGQSERLPRYSYTVKLRVPNEDEVHHYTITSEWKTRVRAALKNQGRGAQSRLAKAIGASTGQLAEILGAESKHSTYVARIHAYFGWDPPPLPFAHADVGEISHLVRPMSKRQRQKVGILLQAISARSPDDADAMLDALIELSGLARKPKENPR